MKKGIITDSFNHTKKIIRYYKQFITNFKLDIK